MECVTVWLGGEWLCKVEYQALGSKRMLQHQRCGCGIFGCFSMVDDAECVLAVW